MKALALLIGFVGLAGSFQFSPQATTLSPSAPQHVRSSSGLRRLGFRAARVARGLQGVPWDASSTTRLTMTQDPKLQDEVLTSMPEDQDPQSLSPSATQSRSSKGSKRQGARVARLASEGLMERESDDEPKTSPRVRRLRDVIFKKECYEALTTAEFALKLDISPKPSSKQDTVEVEIPTIDYDRILSKLSYYLQAVKKTDAGQTAMSPLELSSLFSALQEYETLMAQRAAEAWGKASYAADDSEDKDRTPDAKNHQAEGETRDPEERPKGLGGLRFRLFDGPGLYDVLGSIERTLGDTKSKVIKVADGVKKREEYVETALQAFVREDGSLDFDSVRVPPRDEVVRMGSELWARLNGVAPGEEGLGKNKTALKLTLETSASILSLEEKMEEAKAKLEAMESERQDLLLSLGDIRSQKQTEASSVAPSSSWREEFTEIISKLRGTEENSAIAEQEFRLWELELNMERIFQYLLFELDLTDEVQEQQKLVVAEFGLLDNQVQALRGSASKDSRDQHHESDAALSGLQVDPDELSIVARDVLDLERRLGIDEVLGSGKLEFLPKVSFSEIQQKIADGSRFYWEGSKLLGTDVQYALKLILQAAIGRTLSPREVRTLQRTFKDLVTFIPFIIILLIPLSPVGHVLVFSFIQKVFPDFFPTPYTDRRQNLMRIYQSTRMAIPDTPRSSQTMKRGTRLRGSKTFLRAEVGTKRPGQSRSPGKEV